MVKSENFTPFFGVVEDVDDPSKHGRVKVRVHGYHSQSKGLIPTEGLQWMQAIISNSTGVKGRGKSPTGYEVGTTVFGYFVDKMLQSGIVVGALIGKTQGQNDVSGLATGDSHQIHDLKQQNRIENIQLPLAQGSWAEPPYAYNTQYPNNNVYESHRGHVKEYDDTPGSERIHEYHRAGTYYEIDAQGNKVVKIVGDGYEIIAGNKFANVKGTVSLTIEGNVNEYIKGNVHRQIDGNLREVVQGDVEQYYSNHSTEVTGSYTSNAGTYTTNTDNYQVNSGKINLNEG